MLNNLGGRKFILTVLLLIALSIFVVLHAITAEQWLDLVKWLTLGYLGANAASKWFNEGSKK